VTVPEDEKHDLSQEDLIGQGWHSAVPDIAPPPPPGDMWQATRRGQRLVIRGRVHGITQRQDKDMMVYAFRVDSYDKSGSRLSYPVEMLSKRFSGLLNEGDLVQFTAKVKEGQVIRISKLRNLTTRGAFRKQGSTIKDRAKLIAGLPGMFIYAVLYIAFFVGFIALLILLIGELFGGTG
jgi:hypothetical protein